MQKKLKDSNINLDKELYGYLEGIEFSDDVKKAVKSIIDLAIPPGTNDISLDIDDLKVILKHGMKAVSGIAEYKGINAPTKAIKIAIENSSLDYASIQNAKGVLIHFLANPKLANMEIYQALEVINENVNSEADVIFGLTTDEKVDVNYVQSIILFTGC